MAPRGGPPWDEAPPRPPRPPLPSPEAQDADRAEAPDGASPPFRTVALSGVLNREGSVWGEKCLNALPCNGVPIQRREHDDARPPLEHASQGIEVRCEGVRLDIVQCDASADGHGGRCDIE